LTASKLHPFWWLVPPECYERFVNRGFETGDLTGWERYPSPSSNVTVEDFAARSGSYGAVLWDLGVGLKQIFSTKPYTNYIETFQFYFRAAVGNGVTLNVRVYYTDGNYTEWIPSSGATTAWKLLDLLPKLASNKYVDYILFWFAGQVGSDDVYVDDFTLVECIPA